MLLIDISNSTEITGYINNATIIIIIIISSISSSIIAVVIITTINNISGKGTSIVSLITTDTYIIIVNNFLSILTTNNVTDVGKYIFDYLLASNFVIRHHQHIINASDCNLFYPRRMNSFTSLTE